MTINQLITDASAIPSPKHKTKRNNLDSWEPFLALRHMVLERKLRPMQQVGIYFTPQVQEQLDMKLAGRVAALRLKKLVKDIGAEADYTISYYQTNEPGTWFLKVTFEPPMTKEQPREARKGSKKSA